ncbi:MAG TPA: SET domain-containing protein [Lacibacter sp.]|nr:SET domain-containing protein [Lacibacter sp.]HMO89387.1 SET domain-containing protein [Lacibacter sp.]HMP86618.1 SET domain-containing protein [Lacibacter sp.]
MTREELLRELHATTYVALRPSPLHGIGVFALRPIPKGCRELFSTGEAGFIRLGRAEVESLPEHSRNLVETYCLYDADSYYVPDHGFKVMDLSFYLNHSDMPNVQSIEEGAFFEALRDIAPGEELLVDYGTLVDDEEQ